MVYVPGIDGSGRLLLGTADLLAERFRLICIRYRTDHDAPAPADPYGALAASVARCLEAAGVSRAVIVAESFGGAVAMRIALDHPQRVAGLALVNTFARYRARLRLACARAITPLVPGWVFRLSRRWFGWMFLFGWLREAAACRDLVAVRLDGFPRDYARRLEMIAGLDLLPRLPELGQPVALFASERDLVVRSVTLAREMQAALPDAELSLIPRGGHVVLPLLSLPWVDSLEKLCERAGLAAD